MIKKDVTINGIGRTIIVDPDAFLADVLRQQMLLTGTKVGCGQGQCGACSVIMNGKVIRSCITKMKRVPDDAVITTIEGLGTAENLHPIQWAFVVSGAIQCGFCTPGFIMSAKALLDQNPNPAREDIRDWFQKNRNACRCTGYKQIVDAVIEAAAVLRGEKQMQGFSELLGKNGNVWGTAYPRPSAIYKATGAWDFGDDYRTKLPSGTLFAAIVHAEVSHANLKDVDTSEAEKMRGVYRVITAKDIKGTNRLIAQLEGYERPILCDKKIYQYGDSIAIVCADTEENARAAAEKVKADLEELPAYMSVMEALSEDAVEIHPGMPNLCQTLKIKKGENTAPLMENAACMVEDDFYLQRQPHMPIEPDVGFGYVDEQGRLTIHSKSIWIFFHASQIAPGLGLEADQIRIVENGVGGTFGYKLSITCEALIGAAVLATGRPVFLHYDMRETFIYTTKRSPFHMHLKYGADRNGKIMAMESNFFVDHGPYTEFSSRLTERGTQFMGAPYGIPNIRGQGQTIISNHSWGGAFRAYGSPQSYLATEVLMDELAGKMGMDPLDLREINVLRPGDTFPFGQTPDVFPFPAMIKKIRPGYEEAKRRAKAQSTDTVKKGVGIAVSVFSAGHDGPDVAETGIELTPDGVTIYSCWEDHGQGGDIGTLSTAHEALREALNLRPEQIRLVMNDTALVPKGIAASGSSSQVVMGNAIVDSCNKLLDAMRKPDGGYRTYEEMMTGNIPIRYTGSYESHIRDENGKLVKCTQCDENRQGRPFETMMYAVFMAEVAVDITTGKVRVEKFTLISDVGKINNYAVVEGQFFGGIVQGIGLALSEDFEDVKKHTNFISAGLPYIKDAPDDIQLIHMETPREFGPFGASGVGELPLTAPHPAIINAIYNACGVRITRLPALPEKVLAGCKGQ